MTTNKSSPEIPVMTGVRFLAALMIFVYHYADRFRFLGAGFMPYLKQLFLGVEVFFVLSGFIIAYTYFEQSELSKKFLHKYFVRRLARIYPLYFLLTIATFWVLYNNVDSHSGWTKQFILNLSLLKGFSSNYHLSGIVPTWSLTVEETFYLLAPIIFILAKRRRLFMVQIPFVWLIGALLVFAFSRYPFDGFFSSGLFTAFVTFFGRCFEFYCGIWLAMKFKADSNFFYLNRTKFPVLTLLGLITMFSVLILLVEIEKHTVVASSLSWSGIATCNLVFPLGVTIFFAGLLREKSWLQSFLSTSLLQVLGKSSYAFFLVHTGIFATAINQNFHPNILVLLFLLIALSILLYFFVEKPINLFIRKTWTR